MNNIRKDRNPIKLNKKNIKLFNLPLPEEEIKEDIELFINSIEDNIIEIKIYTVIWIYIKGTPKKFKSILLTYKKKGMSNYELIFVGWAYKVLYESNR